MWHSKQHYMEIQALKMRALADLAGAPQTFFFLNLGLYFRGPEQKSMPLLSDKIRVLAWRPVS